MQGVGPTHDFLKHSKTGKLRCACLVRAVGSFKPFFTGYFYGNDRCSGVSTSLLGQTIS